MVIPVQMKNVKFATQGEKMQELQIKDLHVNIEGKEILKGVKLDIGKGEIHALMGPNGSGKSTLSLALMGHPKYDVVKGKVFFYGNDLLKMTPDERAKAGIFLSFQYPSEISGVGLTSFLKAAYNETHKKKKTAVEFMQFLYRKMDLLKMDREFAKRQLNVGFSGGEKKRCEILQMAILEPKLAILDETDSGLDVDSLRIVAEGIKKQLNQNMSVLIITHYQRILHYIKPDRVHVMHDGKIIASGDYKMAEDIEKEGYKIFNI